MQNSKANALRHDWTLQEIQEIYQQPFNDLLFAAQNVHRQYFDPNRIQVSTLLSVKTGACPEDCAYCPQSGHYDTGIGKEKLLTTKAVRDAAHIAKDNGATRFCMGGAWRAVPENALEKVSEFIREVKAIGLETCASFGLLSEEHAHQLKAAGLDYYNHNIDSSEQHYEKIIGTRTFQQRLDTIQNVQNAGINVCCGGIVGLGETTEDHWQFLQTLSHFNPHPPSVPINQIVPIPGTPLENQTLPDPFTVVRIIATARMLMPTSMIRLSAGRNEFGDSVHALCFFAGANSIHYGEKLFVTPLPSTEADKNLLTRLGMTSATQEELRKTTQTTS